MTMPSRRGSHPECPALEPRSARSYRATLSSRVLWMAGISGGIGLSLFPAPVNAAYPGDSSRIELNDRTPSFRNLNTFFLFRDELDELQQPARLSGADSNLLYTLLANAGGAQFSLGLRLPIGPGALAIFATGTGSSSYDTTSTDTFDWETGDAVGSLTETSWATSKAGDLWLAYGLPLGPVHLGVGIRGGLSRTDASADGNGNWAGANSEYTDFTFGSSETVTGAWAATSSNLELRLAGGYGERGGFFVDGAFSVRRNSRGALLEVSTVQISSSDPETSDDDQLSENTLTGGGWSSPTNNLTGLFFGLEVNPEYGITEDLGVEIWARAEAGAPDLTYPTFEQHYVDPSVDQMLTATYSDLEGQSSLDVAALGTVQYRFAPNVELRGGIGYRQLRLSSSLTAEAEATVTAVETGETSISRTVSEQEYSVQQAYLMLPVALEVMASNKLTVRLGAQYAMVWNGEQDQSQIVESTQDGEPVAFSDIRPTSEVRSASPVFSYALGLEARPARQVRLALTARNIGVGQAVQFTNGGLQVYGSAILEW